jgi:hypothetical protein
MVVSSTAPNPMASSAKATPLSPSPSTPTAPKFSGDQFQSRKVSGATQLPAAPRFGGGNPAESGGFGKFLRNVGAATLGVLSGVGLAVGIPLGLAQMAIGIFIHPLLVTGALTMGIPFLGMIGAILLGKK